MFEYMFVSLVFHVSTISKFENLGDLCIYDPRCLPEEVQPL